VFEHVHEIGGYLALVPVPVVVALGLQAAEAPNCMGWLIGAALVGGLSIFTWLQWSGCRIDTYQAIWGPAPEHPGNRRRPIGWGVRRFGDWIRCKNS